MTDLMKENFKDIVNTKFTANMEDKIEDVADGSTNWKEVIRDFMIRLKRLLKKQKKK